MLRDRRRARVGMILPIAFCVGLLTYAVWPWLPFARAAQPPRTIVFYGFSILSDVMTSGIFPAFQKAWAAEGKAPVESVSHSRLRGPRAVGHRRRAPGSRDVRRRELVGRRRVWSRLAAVGRQRAG